MVLRALGPSLSGFGLSEVLADPVAPANLSESAIVRTLAPGAYTVIVTGKDATPPSCAEPMALQAMP